jgi:hypothetical protein
MLARMRHPLALALFLFLPGCVAAIGNTGYGPHHYPPSTAPILQEQVTAANRVVELRQRRLDTLRQLNAAGTADAAALLEAEIQVEEARIRLLECRAELSAVESKKKDG